jgi:cytochrome c-type biogenesis protein CcmH
MFAIALGAMLIVVILFLVYPLLKQSDVRMPEERETFYQTSEDQERNDLELEKERLLTSLLELETEKAEGRLNDIDYQRLKGTDENRLVKVLDRLDQLSSQPKTTTHTQWQRSSPHPDGMFQSIKPVLLGLLVVGGTLGIYSYVNGKIGLEAQRIAIERQAQMVQGMPNPLEMVARLEARLRENPDDLQGQIMAGRSYMALDRFDDAKKAWSKVIELDRRSHEAHFNLGWILIQTRNTEDPGIFEEALAHFDAALINVPREPAVLWYRGVALVHLKRFREADESWTTAYQNLSPDSEDAEFIKEALQGLRAGNFSLPQ